MIRPRRHRVTYSVLPPPLRKSRILPAPRGRVLVVDAHPDMRELLLTILKTEGYDVDLAEDGELALARCRTRPADVVLMDLDLPGKPGAAAIRELGAEFPDVVIVAMSGDADPLWHDALAEARIAGARLTVRKPLEPWLLLRALEGLLAGRKLLLDSRLHRSA
jgi:CheY-like chemotaxis protein